MKQTITLAIACVVFASFHLFAQSKEEKEVAAAVEVLRKAMVDGDEATLTKITAKELTYGHSSGTIEDQAAFVSALATGKSDFVKIDLEEQTVSMVGDIALVRHKLMGDLKSNGNVSPVKLGVLLVWQKRQGEWKLLARQAFRL
jgi:ketosteroid isomerase-like protein